MNRTEGGGFDLTLLPNEVIFRILKFLPAQQFMKCRLVCTRLLDIIDTSLYCEDLWKRYSYDDFKEICEDARKKSPKEMTWFETYRTLRSWSMVGKAAEDKRDFFVGPKERKEIQGFQLLNNGVIGLHTKLSIDYHELSTMERCDQSIFGEFYQYMENENYVALLNFRKEMVVKYKNPNKVRERLDVPDVRRFILKDHLVYFTVYAYHKEYLHIIDLTKPNPIFEYINRIYDPIVSMGFVNGIFYYSNTKPNVYRLDDKCFTPLHYLRKDDDIMHHLRNYDLINRLDWSMYTFWLLNYNIRIANGVLCGITSMRVHGDVYIVGCKWGFMRIYYAPYKHNILDIYTSRPVKQFKLIEREYHRPDTSLCPIIQIDVMETPEGHNVIAVLPMKVVQMRFTNNFTAFIDPATCGRRRLRQLFWETNPTPLKTK